METQHTTFGKARSFDQIMADRKGTRLPSQSEIDDMVKASLAKIAKVQSVAAKPLPRMLSADPVENMIRKVDDGTADPREVDAMIDGLVRKSMLPEDRNLPAAFARLANANDKTLGRLYSARTLAASTFNKDAIGNVTNRVAAEEQVAEIEAEIKSKADDLRRQFHGKFTQEQATSEVLAGDPEIYSRWMQAKAATKPNA
jgi:hypothetical protein